MRHRLGYRKLSRNRSHRKAMLQQLVRDLFIHGRITTTVTRAKEARRMAEKMITLGKQGDLPARRRAASVLQDPELVKKLFGDLAARFKERKGGYTRILRLGGCRWDGEGRGRYAARRLGDNGERAFFELVDRKEHAEERYLAGRGSRVATERENARKARKKAAPKK